MTNLFDHFHQRSDPATDLPCLTPPGGESITYGRIMARSAQMAGTLTTWGLTVDDRLVAQVDKSTDAVALYLACLRAGIVYVPLNTAYTPEEVRFFVEDTGAALVVCDPARLAEITDIAGETPVETMGVDGDGSLPEIADGSDPYVGSVERGDDDIACFLYTSGTTGRSKGAMLTHGALFRNAEALRSIWKWRPDDVLLHTLPIFHVHGLFVSLHCALLEGSEVIFCSRFDVGAVRQQLPRSTVLMGVPTHYIRLLADPGFGADDCASIRLFTSGSAPMTELVFEEFEARTGHRVVERYGMTEAGIITSNPYDGERVAGTVGYALPGYDVRVVDEMVEVKGPYLFAGYWQLPDKTAEAMTDDGYFRTGDIGELTDDGRLTLSGRAGDLIISGGLNVYPKEIELVLDQVGVGESAVVGVPHPDFGEGVVAVVAAGIHADHASELQAACNGKLARFKHPKHYVFVDELPKNALGKVQKVELRTRYHDTFTRSGTG